jgi:glucose-6-phosphate 1-dehydrogenase
MPGMYMEGNKRVNVFSLEIKFLQTEAKDKEKTKKITKIIKKKIISYLFLSNFFIKIFDQIIKNQPKSI